MAMRLVRLVLIRQTLGGSVSEPMGDEGAEREDKDNRRVGE